MPDRAINTNSSRNAKQNTDIRFTKSNYEFDVYSDFWQLDANKKINFELLAPLGLTSEFEQSFKLALADYACEFSAAYTDNLFRYCQWFFSTGVTDEVLESHIINYKASLDKSNEYKLGYIRGFILDWYDKEIPGIDKNAVELLESLKLSGNEKGKAVALGCPYSGAYTFEEQADFISWYIRSFSDGVITLSDYALIMLLQKTGARPVQISHMYVGDIKIRVEEGIEHFDLRIPNAKKRESFRGSFQIKKDTNEDLVLVLKQQANRTIEFVENHFEIKLSADQIKRIPLFLNVVELEKLTSYRQFESVQQLTPDLLCIRLNSVNDSISNKVRRIAQLCPLKTKRIEIEGEYGDLHINPRRFRYTHATNLAMLGASDYVIAEDLGHSDTQQVGVYTEFNEDIAERIDEALASDLIPLAQAFAGTLIDGEKDAIRANDPRSRIYDNSGDEIGNCGEFGFCGQGALHCYTCHKFQPWLNADHEAVLEHVVAKRDYRKQLGASEFVLQGANRTIKAIKAVIQKCTDRKLELEKEGSLND